MAAGIFNRVAPAGQHLEVARELALQVAKNPPLSVRSTVRTRRWYMERLVKEANFIAQPFRLYLTEDFKEAATAFAEKRPPRGFKGR
jgi:enoyl-CoA hydratase/carnithine racemase